MIINLQRIPGFSECASQLKILNQIESTFAELEVGKLLFIHRVRFEFNKPTGIRRHDYDLRIWCPSGREAVADTKCKAETGHPSRNTIYNSLDRARQQLPDGTPGIVFIKVPRLRIEDEDYTASLRNIASEFLNGTSRVVSVKFYVTSVITDIDNITDILAVDEVNTQKSDFGCGLDWKLFPTVALTDPESLLMSVGWFLLQNSGTSP